MNIDFDSPTGSKTRIVIGRSYDLNACDLDAQIRRFFFAGDLSLQSFRGLCGG